MTDSPRLPEINWPEGISDAQKDDLREILLAFDVAASELERDHTVIFPSDQERLRLFHAAQEKWFKAWSKPGPCMHPRCGSVSIARSHSIPMSASLREIAEHGHVVTLRMVEAGLEAARIGVRDASTFPGFCDVHEAQFAEFESQKKLTTADHFYLQAFRTICREIYAKRHYMHKLQGGLNDYRKLRDAFIAARVRRSNKPIEFTNVTFKNDQLEDRAIEHIATASQDLVELERLYQGVLAALETGADDVVMTVAKIDLKFPVCLSGIGGIGYKRNGAERRALCLLAVIPEATETNFIIGGESAHADFLKDYMKDDSSTAMLGRVESWMCNGSDHWFMTPSVWQAIPQVRKDAVYSRILDSAHSFAYPVEFSVLDRVRSRIIASAEDQLQAGEFPAQYVNRAKQVIFNERAKLNWVGPET